MLASMQESDGTYSVIALYAITQRTIATGFATNEEAQAKITELERGGK